MSGKGKDSSSSSSTNNSLDEIEALLKEKFYDFSKKLISIKEKFDTVPVSVGPCSLLSHNL